MTDSTARHGAREPAAPDSPTAPRPDAAAAMERLLAIMARLRNPDSGCPWDLEQDFTTIAPYTIEEAYEVAEAIARGDMAELKDELGDLLLQVVFHARMAEEAGSFGFADVANAICDKMIRRHPHVFGEENAARAEQVKGIWEAQKERERAAKNQDGSPASALDGVALALPALIRAEKLQKRAARVGFDWPEAAEIFAKIDEEVAELKHELGNGAPPDRVEDEIGDLLFTVANLARRLNVDPERALMRSSRKFERRFKAMEQRLADDGVSVNESDLETLEAAWQAAKADEAL